MEFHDVMLISMTYTNRDEDQPDGKRFTGPEIEMFGRTREGKSITALYRGFYPHFVLIDPPQTTLDALSKDPNILKIEPRTLFQENRPVKAYKVTLIRPGDTPTYRDKYNAVAADIVFTRRFLYDHGLGLCVRVHGTMREKKRPYRTELVMDAAKIEPADPFSTPLKILSFDIENLADNTIVCIGLVKEYGGARQESILVGPEPKILQDFTDTILNDDVDVISGFNICNYDVPLIAQRCLRHRVSTAWTRNGRDIRISSKGQQKSAGGKLVVDKGTNTTVEISGRLVVDSWYFARKEKRPKRETLSAMAQAILGKDKLDVNTSKMDQEWANNRELVKKYCVQDTVLSHEILLAIKVLDKYAAIANVAMLPLADVFLDRHSILIDSMMIRQADKENVVVPNNRRSDDSESIEGGYVHTPLAGLYDNVFVFDFASLYPSVIIQNNICFTTISDDGTIDSPIGCRFLGPDVKLGILPRIMKDLLDARRQSKKKMKAAKTPDEKAYYNSLQLGQKILANAHYGVFASKFYRFTDRRIGGSITAIGRKYITDIIADLNHQGLTVVYSDTDSVFVKAPDGFNGKAPEEVVEYAEKISKKFSHGAMDLEYEKLISPLFLGKMKKRYFGRIVHPTREVIVRGYETRRGDSFPLLSRGLETIFDKIMDKDVDGAVRYAKETLASIGAGGVPNTDLVISKTIADESVYKLMHKKNGQIVKPEDRLTHIQAKAKAERDFGVKIPAGMKVSWIVTHGGQTPQRVEPYLDGIPFKYTPDYNYYQDKLCDAYLRILENFDYHRENLIEEAQQSLFC